MKDWQIYFESYCTYKNGIKCRFLFVCYLLRSLICSYPNMIYGEWCTGTCLRMLHSQTILWLLLPALNATRSDWLVFLSTERASLTGLEESVQTEDISFQEYPLLLTTWSNLDLFKHTIGVNNIYLDVKLWESDACDTPFYSFLCDWQSSIFISWLGLEVKLMKFIFHLQKPSNLTHFVVEIDDPERWRKLLGAFHWVLFRILTRHYKF